MQAMVLAAGLGLRARPLSARRPKALFPVGHRPILDIILSQLRDADAEAVIINTHHLAAAIEEFLSGRDWGLKVEISYEPQILDTGGGIKKCASFLRGAPFFVVNSDVFHTFDLKGAYNYHLRSGNLATLLLYDHPPTNQVEVDEGGKIRRIGIKGERALTFTGIQVISPELLQMMPDGAFSIIEFYQLLIEQGAPIGGYMAEGYWRDIGSLPEYLALHRDIIERQLLPFEASPLHPEAQIEQGAKIEGAVWIGKGSLVSSGAYVRDSVLWEGVRVEEGSVIEGCVVADGAVVRGVHRGEGIVPG